METKANYTLIGLFAVGAIIAGFAFVFWFHNIGAVSNRAVYSIRFDGPASGLRQGSAVLFNGIRMGEVTQLMLDPQNPRLVLATVEIDQNAPVRADTKVGLDFQGLTGIASVALTGGSPSAPALVSTNGRPPLLVADAAATQDVTQVARDALRRIDALLAEDGTLTKTFKNAQEFTDTLARNSERIDNILAGFENLSGGPQGNGDIQKAAQAVRQLAENMDKHVAEVSAGFNRFSATGAREIEAFAAEGRRTLGEIDRTVKNLDRNPSRLLFGGSGNSVPAYNGH
ncbi:MAG TPA: MlaD family protein [Xanthobacteraceae bacterium]|nr:MlaD family protein [Xanthobacteraceae bacterium]